MFFVIVVRTLVRNHTHAQMKYWGQEKTENLKNRYFFHMVHTFVITHALLKKQTDLSTGMIQRVSGIIAKSCLLDPGIFPFYILIVRICRK